MYKKIVQLLKNLPPDQHQLIVDKLVIPKTFARQFKCLSNIQTNYMRRQNRASMWVMDLLLCALNNSVFHPHFKGNRVTEFNLRLSPTPSFFQTLIDVDKYQQDNRNVFLNTSSPNRPIPFSKTTIQPLLSFTDLLFQSPTNNF